MLINDTFRCLYLCRDSYFLGAKAVSDRRLLNYLALNRRRLDKLTQWLLAIVILCQFRFVERSRTLIDKLVEHWVTFLLKSDYDVLNPPFHGIPAPMSAIVSCWISLQDAISILMALFACAAVTWMSHSILDNRSNYCLLLRQILLTLEFKWRWFSILNLEWLLFFHFFNALDSLLLSENRHKLCAMIVYGF